MLSLLMPSRIEIVEPFTRVTSFDDDPKPDGIELVLRAVNALDNPGLMIVGQLRIELYEFVPASGDRRAKRLDQWTVELNSVGHQRDHWNPMTQMYELRLGMDPARIPPADKYIIVVTYDSPLGKRLTDDFTVRYRTETGTIGPVPSMR